MGRSVVLSVLLHALFVTLAVVGLPTLSRPVVLPPAVDVELARDLAPVRTAPASPPAPGTPEPEAVSAEPVPSPPAPPEPVTAAPVPEPEPDVAAPPVDAAPMPAAPPPAPAQVVPPVPQAPPPPATAAPVPEPVEPAAAAPSPETARAAEAPPPPSRLDDMLRDLAERTPGSSAPENPSSKLDEALDRYAALDPPPASGARETPVDRFARARMEGLIQRQIRGNWRRPPALQEDEDMYVILEFQLQPDGTIHDLRVSEAERRRINQNAQLRSFLDSAQTAILKTGKISGLPADKYASWRHMRLFFRP